MLNFSWSLVLCCLLPFKKSPNSNNHFEKALLNPRIERKEEYRARVQEERKEVARRKNNATLTRLGVQSVRERHQKKKNLTLGLRVTITRKRPAGGRDYLPAEGFKGGEERRVLASSRRAVFYFPTELTGLQGDRANICHQTTKKRPSKKKKRRGLAAKDGEGVTVHDSSPWGKNT